MKSFFQFFLLLALVAHLSQLCALDADNLDHVHQTVAEEFKRVEHIDPETLLSLEPDNFVIFDVREKEEFEVSRISGAIQVDPDISNRQFFQLYDERIQSKTVIFYCSVGYRSSKLAEQLMDDPPGQLSSGFYNLQGGIFNWHNNQHPLIDQNGETDDIHAYNSKWSRLVTRKEKIRF